MSIFPAKVLLAVDGSGESDLDLRSAVDLAWNTGSELHVVHVREGLVVYRPEQHGYRVQLRGALKGGPTAAGGAGRECEGGRGRHCAGAPQDGPPGR
ncbi:universal stress protein [Rubrobacter radiotolerans]|uniref:universal stress protein n=1 Tax=Rubrobacter radiotolerans TaxID=42256 RepID=UPI002FBEFD6F